jgi:hypothetical protein
VPRERKKNNIICDIIEADLGRYLEADLSILRCKKRFRGHLRLNKFVFFC